MASKHAPPDSNDDSISEDSSSKHLLNSAISRYHYENGRTYHTYRDGEYWGPNDDIALNHEVIVHHLCLLTLQDRHFLAPVEEPRRILDIGTGKGLWAVDVADRYPEAKVIGIDFSLPPAEAHPENLEFVIDDATSEWAYDDDFDFIHIRGLFGSIADWPALYAQIFEHLHPGGYLEHFEWSVIQKSHDGSLAPDSILAEWSRTGLELGVRSGKTLEIAENMAGYIAEAGFVDIHEECFEWPIGAWSQDPLQRKIGLWNLRNWNEGLEGWGMALYTRILKWTPDQVREKIRDLKRALKDRKVHAYHEVRLVYARKPIQ